MLLDGLKEAGYSSDVLASLQQVIDAEKSDLFDVLEYVAFSITPITRAARVAAARPSIQSALEGEQGAFLDFVLSKYVDTGVEELAEDKLGPLLVLRYKSIPDATEKLGSISHIRSTFMDFQRWLYV